ncbi:putative Co/Zn/Cd efflux system membrane fusion protein, partial [Pseudomonas savastanoi]
MLLTGFAGYKEALKKYYSRTDIWRFLHMRRQTLTVTAVVLLIACAAIAGWKLTRPATLPKNSVTAVPVKVITVSIEDVPRFVTGIGSVLSLQSVVIRPQVDGVLTRVLVKEGQQVK